MKQLAILKYSIMFDPSEAWSSGSQFENQLSDFFVAYGFEAQIIEARGGTGERVVWLEKLNTPAQIAQKVPQPKEAKPAEEQIKQVQQRTPNANFKQFIKKAPIQADGNQKLTFQKGTSDLRQEVHKLPHVNFRKVKR